MHSLLDPAILFFVFGLLAGLLRSNLELPQPISKFLSMYLLMALGLKGGFALAASGLTSQVLTGLGLGLLLAFVVPLTGYLALRKLLPPFDAAAVAATYGSVSAVTFVTAVQSLDRSGIAFGGHMAATMALMESPAILLSVLLANYLRRKAGSPMPSGGTTTTNDVAGLATPPASLRKVLHESLTDGAQLLLLGAMAVGVLTGEAGKAAMAPFSIDLFKGMLAFFLLDMGLLTARHLSGTRGTSPWLVVYAIGGPLVHAALALGLAHLAGMSVGDGTLLMVLAASASYIAVPAVLRHAIPEARPALYFGMSLGITFPFNILLGIPLYSWLASRVLV
ncbi:MAG: hypothetical protein RJB26_1343 [Pseudomonadota bacterium]|jgi:hypothetical protein